MVIRGFVIVMVRQRDHLRSSGKICDNLWFCNSNSGSGDVKSLLWEKLCVIIGVL